MTSSAIPEFEEQFSPGAAAFFESLSGNEQEKIAALVACICEDPSVDGSSIFDLSVPPAMWRVLVKESFTIYFRVVDKTIQIDHIKPTIGTLQEMVRYPFNS